jgi:hypothetical protein
MTAHTLIVHCRALGVTLAPGSAGKLRVHPAGILPDELRQELKQRKAEVLRELTQQESRFFSHYMPSSVQEVFPDWQGLLINSAMLAMSVWVVRTREDGQQLAQETGHPALLLDEMLSQQGKSAEDARAALLPVLITGRVQ